MGALYCLKAYTLESEKEFGILTRPCFCCGTLDKPVSLQPRLCFCRWENSGPSWGEGLLWRLNQTPIARRLAHTQHSVTPEWC